MIFLNIKTSQPYKSKIMIALVLNSVLLNGPNVVTAKHEDLKQPRTLSLLKTTDFFGNVGTKCWHKRVPESLPSGSRRVPQQNSCTKEFRRKTGLSGAVKLDPNTTQDPT